MTKSNRMSLFNLVAMLFASTALFICYAPTYAAQANSQQSSNSSSNAAVTNSQVQSNMNAMVNAQRQQLIAIMSGKPAPTTNNVSQSSDSQTYASQSGYSQSYWS